MIHKIREEMKKVTAPSLLLTFTLFIFGPIELYITNASNFWFPIKEMLIPLLIVFIITFTIISMLNIFLKKFAFIYTFTFSLGFAFYLQGNWMQVDYGTMDGVPIDWSSYGSWGITNLLIWCAILIIPTVVGYIIKNKNSYKAILNYISLGIVCVECITLLTIALTSDFSKNSIYVERDGEMFQFSKEKNIVVMLFDAFQASYFQQAIEEIPEAKEVFSGFTFYDNAVGTSLYSQEGQATVYTGLQMQADKNLVENVDYIYINSDIIKALKEEDYDIRYYVLDLMMSPNMVSTIQNVKPDSSEVSPVPLTKMMLKITSFRYMPHILKQDFWFSYDEIEALKVVNSQKERFVADDFRFNDDIQKMTSGGEEKSYRVYYFKGVHHPYNMTKDVEYIDYGTSKDDLPYVSDIRDNEMLYQQTLGSVRIMMNFIEELKAQGLYDNTDIVITGDHGWENRYNPLLLVKPQDACGDFTVSHAPISYIEDFAPTMLSFIGQQYVTGKTIFDYNENDQRTRKFYVYENIAPADRTYAGITVYETEGMASDPLSFYIARDEEELNYILGEEILFNNNVKYPLNGFSYGQDGGYPWSVGRQGRMRFHIENVSEDLLASISFNAVYRGKQHLIVKSEGKTLYDGTVLSSAPTIQFEVPSSCVKEDILTLDFYYPDAVAPIEVDPNSTDDRELAVSFSKMLLVPLAEEFKYELGSEITFSPTSNGMKYFESGVSTIETDFVWSLGTESQMKLNLGSFNGDLQANFKFKFTVTDPQRFIVKCDDQILYEGEVTKDNLQVQFIIPEKCIQDGVLILDLSYPDAVAPSSIHPESSDTRVLSVAFSEITFTSAES